MAQQEGSNSSDPVDRDPGIAELSLVDGRGCAQMDAHGL